MKLTLVGGTPPVAVATNDSISLETKLNTFDRIPEDDVGSELCSLAAMVRERSEM